MPFLPRLRPDLEVTPTPDGVLLGDPLFRRRLDLGAIGDVLAKLDGRPAEDLVAEGPRTEQVLRTLLLLQMLDGTDARVIARMRDVQRGRAPLELRTLPGSRFACQGSGACCQNYVFGPLTDADVARVESNDLTPFGIEGPFYEMRPRPDGRSERFLRTTPDGRCVFLDRANRCGLHGRYGGASKPGFCQLFPLVVWPTLSGLRVYDGGECASFPASAASGVPLEDLFAEVKALVPGNVALQHPLVHLAPGAPCDFGVFLPVLDALVESVNDATPPADVLRALVARLDAAIHALRTCPITPEAPFPSLEAALASPPVSPAPSDGRSAVADLAREVHEIVAAPLAQGYAPPFTHELLRALSRLAASAEGTAPPLPPGRSVADHLAFRQYLFGQRALVDGRPRAALLRLAFGWLVARAADAEGVGISGQMLVSRRVHMPWAPLHRLWVRREAAVGQVADALTAV